MKSLYPLSAFYMSSINLELKLFLTIWNNFSIQISILDTYLINITWHICSLFIYNLFLIISVVCCWWVSIICMFKKSIHFLQISKYEQNIHLFLISQIPVLLFFHYFPCDTEIVILKKYFQAAYKTVHSL